MNIRNKKDFGAGIMYMVFGLFFALNALNYKMGTAAKMGPGYFPFWLGALLTALGFFVLLKSMSSKNTKEDIGTWNWKIVIWIAGSVVLYGLLLPTLGFMLSVFILVLVSASASHEFTWKSTVLNAIFLVTFTYLAFVQGLNLQFPLLPTFLE
ncbi:MAG: tripartite tricarboxylate transporter TctB family protein [Polynucleobacter sp.]|uniref:tripartite tricarboxylate transporter TctB family protein n=1 Tax=Polynucleobacter sp. HIN8 TaxID=3047867 RepID=UPI001D845912|nr:tripartite tricarboxylate transporter TctB family protein [Polynucleobacter sp. HIN8]MBU3727029.1 tripartite tricarboxylate transporter TctB family protein [Polynucleobacter sp.]NBO85177.1 tripartite tricarboxylate transporter TctB family protein [Burkholderiaceae bacterium]NBO87655.1 tripartite tricarboxylate transporter TctB family protein [Burkholderiaceae bacterium]NCA09007.1 tripartite tricarboxylate transporter TctB family protein [Burkholderiaceae bacterium]NCU94129.1 tripartite tric